MKKRIMVVLGITWGVAGVFILAAVGSTPPAILQGLTGSTPESATVQLVTADHLFVPSLLFLPLAIGLDLLIWTVGLAAQLSGGGSWPGDALARTAGDHAVAWPLVIGSAALVGGVLGFIPVAVGRMLGGRRGV